MKEKKKFTDRFNPAFFILFFPICAIWIYTVYLMIKRPDVIHGFWLLLCSVLLVLDFFWSQSAFFENRDQLNARIRQWNKSRLEAIKTNTPFDEPRPKKSKMLTPVVLVVFAVFLGVYAYSYIPLRLIDAAVPKGKAVYKRDIVELKEKNSAKYGFLPDAVPKGATKVKWIVFPSVMQGDGYEVLSFYLDNYYIESEVNSKCAGIPPQSVLNMPVTNFMTPAERQSAVWYPLHDDGANHRHTWGIVADYNSGFIAYFVQ